MEGSGKRMILRDGKRNDSRNKLKGRDIYRNARCKRKPKVERATLRKRETIERRGEWIVMRDSEYMRRQ